MAEKGNLFSGEIKGKIFKVCSEVSPGHPSGKGAKINASKWLEALD
jgi:hypothetical protein